MAEKLKGELFELLEIVVASITVVFLLFTFVMRVSIVNGSSMCDTLYNGESLVISELFYKPKQGDIVVVQTPKMGYEEPIVKRVIATEGQVIALDTENWVVTVDGVPLDEPYVRRENGEMVGWSYGESYTVPENHIFVMGDNRNHSTDSRDELFVGAVDERFVIGKAIFRFFPLNRAGFLG